jgi:hypothetical protein
MGCEEGEGCLKELEAEVEEPQKTHPDTVEVDMMTLRNPARPELS